ncbi:MAG: xanthine dehydrogenase family protein subunit M [Alphaproteobacteria bacterium]|nr:xanthine dehydrogenase family protein subunit M [Alphaproteobacteria bacterium]
MRYAAPSSIDEAVGLMAAADGSGRILAGGTDLLVQMRAGMVAPGLIVDVKKIAEMTTIAESGGAYRVGAAVPAAVIGEHAKLKKLWPGVVEAINLIGSKQVQGRASPGGNLCNASPAADSVPALVAAGAVVTVQGPKGRRDIPVEKIAAGPGKTTLERGEIVVSFTLPARPAGSGDAYLRLIPRTEMDIAVVGCGVSLTLAKDGTCTAARVGLGAVAPTVLLVDAAGKALVGSKLDAKALDAAAAACRAACKPIDDKRGTIAYRTKIAGVLLKRATAIAAERARSV